MPSNRGDLNLPIYWVDAFTDRTFGGNPAAVIPLDSWLDDALLQRIANENGLSETAFYVRTGPARADLRWFTPAVEVDLCGHATLATAHVLFNELGQVDSPVLFDTKSGVLSVSLKGPLIELDFPSRPAATAEPPANLVAGLGLRPVETLRSERMWLCVYESAEQVMALSPDFGALGTISPGRFIPTAPGTDCDFVSRFFAPDAGVSEDPVTGSAHCTLVPYWATRLGKTKFHARQVSRRTGELWCELVGDRVRIAGKGVGYLKGRISI
jgi:PhzF family phenazine biosynthesis protein